MFGGVRAAAGNDPDFFRACGRERCEAFCQTGLRSTRWCAAQIFCFFQTAGDGGKAGGGAARGVAGRQVFVSY